MAAGLWDDSKFSNCFVTSESNTIDTNDSNSSRTRNSRRALLFYLNVETILENELNWTELNFIKNPDSKNAE